MATAPYIIADKSLDAGVSFKHGVCRLLFSNHCITTITTDFKGNYIEKKTFISNQINFRTRTSCRLLFVPGFALFETENIPFMQ